ncbi:MAG: PEGA domain-containing protein [Kofleriaceae bacterium]|nr:PEGA domain-containing protein [Kofleriaceae bacterium]
MRVLLACALIVAIPSAVRAEGVGVIAVSRDDRAPVARAMAEAVAERGGRVVADAVGEARTAIVTGAVPVSTLQQFRRVRDQIDEGWRAYLRVAAELSASRLATARTAAEPLVAYPGGTELYADAALRLGAVLAYLGRTEESQAVLALALALDPDRPLTLAEFSPDVVAAVDAARAAPVALKQVRITTVPAGAQIRIDGKDVGRAPLDVQVTRGQHLVIARAPLHQPTVQGLPAGAAAIEIQLPPDEESARLSAGAEPGMSELVQAQLVAATQRYAELDEVVLVSDTIRRGAPTLLVQRCAGSPVTCSAVVELGYGERAGLVAAARGAWEAVQEGELRYLPSVLGDRGDRIVDTRCRWCRSPWLWTGVGTAVLAATVLTVMAVTAEKPVPSLTVDGGAFGHR